MCNFVSKSISSFPHVSRISHSSQCVLLLNEYPNGAQYRLVATSAWWKLFERNDDARYDSYTYILHVALYSLRRWTWCINYHFPHHNLQYHFKKMSIATSKREVSYKKWYFSFISAIVQPDEYWPWMRSIFTEETEMEIKYTSVGQKMKWKMRMQTEKCRQYIFVLFLEWRSDCCCNTSNRFCFYSHILSAFPLGVRVCFVWSD